ncbi:MAG: class I SAM-dependent methyltransferase [Deltaproteobacteria bacterium]|nr:class I SAM-dependent methyltransferase [Deltaproteobacteria bacterium]
MEKKAKEFDSIARNIFKPIYPIIAGQIIARTGITSGTCLDIGCGSGYLGAALAKATQLYMHFLDQSPDMIEIVKQTIQENNIQGRSATITGDVSSIALPDNSINLAVSRGSVFFWEDLPQAFREIYRILAPGGWSYIGGGFGNRELKESIKGKMMSNENSNGQFGDLMRRNMSPETRERFETALKTAGINSYSILHNEDIGLWIVMRK